MASLCYSLPLILKFSPLNTKPSPNLSFNQPKSKVRLPKRSPGITRMSLNPTPATDRLISVAAYSLPFFNSLQYGRYLFIQYPQLGTLFEPILPFLSLYKSVPYASFVAFFALYLGVVRNPSFSHYVRFNSMQAVTLDVLLVVPLLLTRILNPGRAGLGFKAMVWGHTGVFVFSCLCFVYGVVSSILGRTPYLPFVADAAAKSHEQPRPAAPSSAPATAYDVQVSSNNVVENGNNQDVEAEGPSIYIKGLPLTATPSMLENEFKKFGPIKSGGIQVRSQKGFCFCFVEFEMASSVQSAIEASPINIGGRKAVVEEKRSTSRDLKSVGFGMTGKQIVVTEVGLHLVLRLDTEMREQEEDVETTVVEGAMGGVSLQTGATTEDISTEEVMDIRGVSTWEAVTVVV
ncbi:hypothetical protein V6N13_002693 [Hibiscus sabdariffa]|uniref:Protein TIC 20 n=1 Tax=Hibiscus sabdariffa TaxID=183260 RepID=A0ABR2BFU3_9ROSI